jgi:hypothetical protein
MFVESKNAWLASVDIHLYITAMTEHDKIRPTVFVNILRRETQNARFPSATIRLRRIKINLFDAAHITPDTHSLIRNAG